MAEGDRKGPGLSTSSTGDMAQGDLTPHPPYLSTLSNG